MCLRQLWIIAARYCPPTPNFPPLFRCCPLPYYCPLHFHTIPHVESVLPVLFPLLPPTSPIFCSSYPPRRTSPLIFSPTFSAAFHFPLLLLSETYLIPVGPQIVPFPKPFSRSSRRALTKERKRRRQESSPVTIPSHSSSPDDPAFIRHSSLDPVPKPLHPAKSKEQISRAQVDR